MIKPIQLAFYTIHHKVNHYECQEMVTKINEIIAALNNEESANNSLRQLRAEIAAFVHTIMANQGECLQQNVDNFIERMRQLSAV